MKSPPHHPARAQHSTALSVGCSPIRPPMDRPAVRSALRHQSDLLSLACLLSWPVLLTLLFTGRLHGWIWGVAYALLIYLSLAMVVIEHNHMHLRIWRRPWLNRTTDTLISIITGHACHVFHATHNANHHRYHHGPMDVARTYRFSQGDTNHLVGYLLHPAQALSVLWPLIFHWLGRMKKRNPAVRRYYLRQWIWVLGFHVVLAILDWRAWGLYVVLPQLVALHWLLGANYLQHAHADGHSRRHFARNFTGGVNRLFFNIGFHTAHHLHPKVHWSELPRWHDHYAPHLQVSLSETSLLRYVLVTLTLGMVWPRAASRSHMAQASETLPQRP